MNKLTQFVDVQSGLEYTRTSNSWGGIMVDRGSASETFARKRGRQLCDSASAATFRLQECGVQIYRNQNVLQ